MAEVTRKGFKDKNGNKVSLIAQVINAITGHFAGLNNKGEVVDSGYGPNDFAESDHIHNSIETEHVALGEANVEVDVDGTNGGEVTISVRKGNGPLKFAVIKDSNIANLIRALLDPDSTPIDESDNLITSQAVYDALSKKTALYDGEGNYDSIISVGKVNRGDDELDGAIINGKSVIRITVNGVSVYVDSTNLANLQRALLPAAPPAPNGTSPITNGQVYAALQEAEGLTVDSALSSSSTNPVQNKEVYSALLGKMDKLPVVKLGYDDRSQDYSWYIRAGVDFLKSIIGDGPQMVVVEADITGQPGVQFKSIGSVNVYYTSSPEVYVELALGNYLFTWDSQIRDASTQSAEEEIENAFDGQAAAATKSTIFS